MQRRDFLMTLGAAAGMMPARWPLEPPQVDGARLNASLSTLATFGAAADGAVNRLAYSSADIAARRWVLQLMRAAGLTVRVDTAGNLIGRRAGTAALTPLLFGSHIDSVPRAGRFDGTVGSMSAIEVARTLAERRVRTRHPLEVVIFQNEEGGLIGSRAMSGDLRAQELELTSRSGYTIRDGIRRLGGDPARLELARRRRGDIAAYLELHIEQGAVLHESGVDIGVVEGIVGINWWDVVVEGFANHAGTTPMNRRRDAMLAAARFTDMVNHVVTSEPGRQVGTVGRIQAEPGAPNVIPGRVVLSLELRDLDAARIAHFYQRIRTEAARIGEQTGTTFSFREINVNVPAPTDPGIRDIIEREARAAGFTTVRLPSGAGHDAQDMARLGPVGMIFVPSVGGISHSPQEYSRPEAITRGANVLLRTLLALDAALS